MKRALIYILIVAAAALGIWYWQGRTPKAANESMEPVRVVESFYRGWTSANGIPLTTYLNNKAVTSELSSNIEALLESMKRGGYDPILCAQDMPSEMTFNLDPVTATTAEVEVNTVFGGSVRTIRVGTVKNGSDWQINSIQCPAPMAADFVKTGNLVINNPGLEKNTWYLVFDEPGAPASQAKLSFASNSICAKGVENDTCDTKKLKAGDRVKITGTSGDGFVLVVRLEYVK